MRSAVALSWMRSPWCRNRKTRKLIMGTLCERRAQHVARISTLARQRDPGQGANRRREQLRMCVCVVTWLVWPVVELVVLV